VRLRPFGGNIPGGRQEDADGTDHRARGCNAPARISLRRPREAQGFSLGEAWEGVSLGSTRTFQLFHSASFAIASVLVASRDPRRAPAERHHWL
jgi:hypothetical protein